MTVRDTWFLVLSDPSASRVGIGECAPLPGLSIDFSADFGTRLEKIVDQLTQALRVDGELLSSPPIDVSDRWPSIQFGLETALLDLANGGDRVLYHNQFSSGQKEIPINGLLWMAPPEQMLKQLHEKVQQGFRCIKMKVGALDFEQELSVLRAVREAYPHGDIELRVDANGAFKPDDVVRKLEKLADLDIHSIEQPIQPGQPELMSDLCRRRILPIALDEELIGVNGRDNRGRLLDTLQPDYLILKPSLLGGIGSCREWIELAELRNIRWWITSALESNIGLNAISQFASTFETTMYQGLGTGSLYHNNVRSPLRVRSGHLGYQPGEIWDLEQVLS